MEADEIRPPARICLRQINHDQEQQSEITLCWSESRVHESRQREYNYLLRRPRFLEILKKEMQKWSLSSSLPVFAPQPTRRFALPKDTLLDTPRLYLPACVLRRPQTAVFQTVKGAEKEDQSARDIDHGPGSPEKTWCAETHSYLRKREVREIIDPILNEDNTDSSYIFLCWGKNHQCHINSVKIQNSRDEVATWEEIRQAWYAYRGAWRKLMPFFGVRKVSIVEISIVAQEFQENQASKYENTFVGIYVGEDLATEKRRLEQIIDNYVPQESPCEYYPLPHALLCRSFRCISYRGNGLVCPEKTLYQVQRGLLRHRLRPLLTFCFLNPSLAPIDWGMIDEERLVHSHRNILSIIRDDKPGELQFRGLMIDEGWRFDSQPVVLPAAATVLLLSVVAAKLIYGDWATAWNCGGFLVSLVTLLWMWADHAVS